MFRRGIKTEVRIRSPRRILAAQGLLAAALVIVAGAGLAPGPALAGSSFGTAAARAAVDFRIVIPSVLRLRMIRQPGHIVVTERDARAGFVEIPEGVELEVTSNLRGGHAVLVQAASPVVKAVRVSVGGALPDAGGDSATVRFARAAGESMRKVVQLGLRLELAGDVAPGVYAWPVSLTLVPA
jgi:hypothetical protein